MGGQRKPIFSLVLASVFLFASAGCALSEIRETGTIPTSGSSAASTANQTEASSQITAATSTSPSETATTPSFTIPAQTTAPTTVPTTVPTVPTTAPTVPTTAPTVPTTAPTVPTTAPTVPTTAPTVPTTAPPEPTAAPPAIPNIITTYASGTLVKSNAKATIDYSNTKDGYVMVCFTGQTSQRLRAQVKGPRATYTYHLTPGKWAAFPFSDENGTYKISIFENVTGNQYANVLSLQIEVVMADAFAPFLRANQYVNFDAAPNTVAKAAALTGTLFDPLKKVEAVYQYVVNHISYDYDLASSVSSGYLPDLDRVLEKKTGICFDYAALMTGMLRSQGIPTKLVVGYAGTVYHAWISVWSEQTGWVDGVIFFDGTAWQRMDPTFASSGGSSAEIMDYIGNGTNYTAKYYY